MLKARNWRNHIEMDTDCGNKNMITYLELYDAVSVSKLLILAIAELF